MRERALHAAASVALAAVLLRGAWGPALRLGVDTSEAPGRIFVSAQSWRWLCGDAPPGTADLLAWPEGRSFWPVDPLVQIVEAPLQAALGPDPALVAVVGLLLALCTFGVARLARSEGGGPVSSLVAGVALTLSPFVLRNLRDAVTESLTLGIGAAAVAASLQLVRAPSWRTAGLAWAAVLALAMTSPYYAVYLAVGWALAAPFLLRRHLRGLGALAAVGAVACALAAAPLVWAEGGQDGRLGPSWSGGYRLEPAPLVLPDGQRARRPSQPGREATAAGASWSSRALPAVVERGIRRTPGGAALVLLAVGALASPAGRPWAAMALGLLLLGPGPGLLARALGLGLDPPPLLPRLLESLPLTAAMGNPERMLGAWALLAAVAGGVALRRRPALAGAALVAVLLGGELEQPRLRAPATRDPVPDAVLAALEGPTVVFPSGDPPAWHPSVSPKETLALAARAGVPVAYDYGRGGTPADLPALVGLARIGRVPLGAEAWRGAAPDTAWAELPFAHILLLEDRLDLQQRQHLRNWLGTHARLLSEAPGVSAWSWPASTTRNPPAR